MEADHERLFVTDQHYVTFATAVVTSLLTLQGIVVLERRAKDV